MKTVTEYKADLETIKGEAQNIVDLARAEKRELTDSESLRLDDLVGTGKEGTDGYKAGLLRETSDALDKAERYEQRMSEADIAMRANRSVGPTAATPTPPDNRRFAIPASARKRGALKSFFGENADRNAYSSGMWFLATMGHSKAQQWCSDHGIAIRMALSEGVDSLGGYLVPEELETSIINLREERGIFRRYARREPMISDTKIIPRRLGGLTMYYVGENQEITASDKQWNSVRLTARKAAVLCKYSSELNEDAVINIADDLAEEIAYSFANGEDLAGFLGDGTSTYGGITGLANALQAGSIVTAVTGNTSFGTLDLGDFEAMIGLLPLYAMQDDPAWYMSRAGWAASAMRLANAAGGNTSENIEGERTPMFLGFPVRWSQVMNSTLTAQTSTNALAYFGSLRQGVAFGDRRGMSIQTSSERYFEFDQLAIKGTERFDIVVHETGTATAPGSIIMLATPSS